MVKERKGPYKEYFILNKNLFLAFIAAQITAALAAQAFSYLTSYLNTSVTMVSEYSVYFGTFGLLYSVDNRKKIQN